MMLKKIPQLVLYVSAEGPSTKDEYTHFVAVEIKMRHQGYVGDDGQHRLNI
jgi:hypothetical protein